MNTVVDMVTPSVLFETAAIQRCCGYYGHDGTLTHTCLWNRPGRRLREAARWGDRIQ